MASQTGVHAPSSVQLHYQLIRTVTSPDEQDTGVKAYVANVLASEILRLGTESNLRTYIPEHSVRKRNRVHEAIRSTIDQEPQRFITRNSGFAVVASGAEVDDNKKTVVLTSASLINGAQSQGEIAKWFADEAAGGDDVEAGEPEEFYVRVEIIVDPDPKEIVETAIARNTATAVKSVSMAGARGILDELEQSVQKVLPNVKIAKSETDFGAFDPRKALQYARLLMPLSVSKNDSASETLRAYKNPEQCLTDFAEWHEAAVKGTDADAAAKYRFTIEIAPYAIQEYDYWQAHDEWSGKYLWEQTKKGGRAVKRDRKTGKVVWVSPGLVFPIVGAMKEFVEEVGGKWVINKPAPFKPGEMIKRAVEQFRSLDSDPMQVGRSSGAYDALRTYPSTIKEVMEDLKAAS